MKIKVLFLSVFILSGIMAFSQTPRTDTIPSLPEKSEVPVDPAQLENERWLNDTSGIKKVHSPRKATLYSAILPGLGQVYNRQYYKVPILAGFGVFFAIMISSNNFDLLQADRNLETRMRNNQFSDAQKNMLQFYEFDAYDVSKNVRFPGSVTRGYTTDQLRLIRDGYRRERDFYIIMSALVYALNIVDAAVFAHLREFKLNNKLSMKLDPDIRFLNTYSNPVAGLSLSFQLQPEKNTSYEDNTFRIR